MHEVMDQDAALVLTGPPYFSSRTEGRLLAGTQSDQSKDRNQAQQSPTEAFDLARDTIQFAWSLRAVFEEMWRVIMPGGWAVLQTRDVRWQQHLIPVEAIHRELMESQGFQLYTRYFWRPIHTTLARRRMVDGLARKFGPLPFDPEVFLVFRKGGLPRYGQPEDRDLTMLSQMHLCSGPGRQAVRHRHHSPLPVVEALIRTYSRPGDLVVDPFAGAGTVLRAGRKLNRLVIGYEVDPLSAEAARRNLQT